jgi:hypothetical protein
MSAPVVSGIPGGYRLIWAHERVQATITRLADSRKDQSTSAEVLLTATDAIPGAAHMHQGRVNLTSTRAKADLAKALTGMDNSIRWADIVEAMCVGVLKLHRQGEPIISVGTMPLSGGQRYRVWPMCPDGVCSVLFGEGGTGKSFIATLIAVLVQSGGSFVGLRSEQGNVLYLDYETSAETLNERVRAICEGLNIAPFDILYRYSYHPLADDIDALRDMIIEHGISFVVVDSLGPACGGDPNDAEMAIRMFNALRELRVTALLIDHIAKNTAEGSKPSPYGSVYKINLARSVWQIKQGQRTEDMASAVGLYHRKANLGPLRSPFGLTMHFTNDDNEQLTEMRFASLSVDDDSDLAKELPLRQRIIAALKDGKLTVHDLAVTLRETTPTLSEDAVRVSLNRMKGGQVVKMGEEWGVLSHDANGVR